MSSAQSHSKERFENVLRQMADAGSNRSAAAAMRAQKTKRNAKRKAGEVYSILLEFYRGKKSLRNIYPVILLM